MVQTRNLAVCLTCLFVGVLSGVNGDVYGKRHKKANVVRRCGISDVTKAADDPAIWTIPSNCGSLDVHNERLGVSGAVSLANALRENTGIEMVSLGKTELGSGAGVAAVAAALKVNTHILHLDLRENNIGDAGASMVAEALVANQHLQWLGLEGNEIGADAGVTIAGALKGHPAIRGFSLGTNKIGNVGAAAVAELIHAKDLKDLHSINLAANGIGDAGAFALARALSKNSDGALDHLDLQNNDIGIRGATAFADALKRNTNARSLDLSGNPIGNEGATAFYNALKDHKSNFKYVGLTDTGADAHVVAMMQENLKNELRARQKGGREEL